MVEDLRFHFIKFSSQSLQLGSMVPLLTLEPWLIIRQKFLWFLPRNRPSFLTGLVLAGHYSGYPAFLKLSWCNFSWTCFSQTNWSSRFLNFKFISLSRVSLTWLVIVFTLGVSFKVLRRSAFCLSAVSLVWWDLGGRRWFCDHFHHLIVLMDNLRQMLLVADKCICLLFYVKVKNCCTDSASTSPTGLWPLLEVSSVSALPWPDIVSALSVVLVIPAWLPSLVPGAPVLSSCELVSKTLTVPLGCCYQVNLLPETHRWVMNELELWNLN